MKKPSELYVPSCLLRLQMLKPSKGNFPIARTDEGVICLIERGAKGYFEYGSVWECEVVEVRQKSLIIRPISLYYTAAQNAQVTGALIKQVFGKPERKRTRKPKAEYAYKASYEK